MCTIGITHVTRCGRAICAGLRKVNSDLSRLAQHDRELALALGSDVAIDDGQRAAVSEEMVDLLNRCGDSRG